MNLKKKIINELKVIFWTTLYFICFLGVLILIKTLLLEEYKIGFSGYSIIVVGALVTAKVVLVLENVSLGTWIKNKPVIVETILRTILYLIGVFVVMVLETAFESRHEYGGFMNALKGLSDNSKFYHVLVNTICVFGALLGFNLWSVIKKHHGNDWLIKILSSPSPNNKK